MEDSEAASFIILAPVFNDWSCAEHFISAVGANLGPDICRRVFLVDDGSTERSLFTSGSGILDVSVIRLRVNLGHQRAIASGLALIAREYPGTSVIVMDGDGEDQPSAIAQLITEHLANPNAIIVAQRRKRTEAVNFRFFYRIYLFLFRILTGRDLDFGNFVLLPSAAVQRLVFMAELWNHFPATVMRSRLPIMKIPIDRGARYDGRSKMNFTMLVNHGLAAIAAFIDAVFVRLMIATGFVLVFISAGALAVLAVRICGTWGVPGWATTFLGILLIGLLQVLGLLVVMTFLALAQRSTPSPPPATFATRYVSSVEELK